MSTNNVRSKKLLSVMTLGFFILATPLVEAAAVTVPKYPGVGCDKEVCAYYLENETQDVYLQVAVPPNAQINLRHGTYNPLWVVAIKNGNEIGRGGVNESRAGFSSLLRLGRQFRGQFEIYITDFKGNFYSNFDKNFQFVIN